MPSASEIRVRANIDAGYISKERQIKQENRRKEGYTFDHVNARMTVDLKNQSDLSSSIGTSDGTFEQVLFFSHDRRHSPSSPFACLSGSKSPIIVLVFPMSADDERWRRTEP
jgi:hypothetical protein